MNDAFCRNSGTFDRAGRAKSAQFKPGKVDRRLLFNTQMLFGRLRSPYQRLAAELRGIRPQPLAARGHSARRLLSLVVLPFRVDGIMDDYAGLDRLDREDLDE